MPQEAHRDMDRLKAMIDRVAKENEYVPQEARGLHGMSVLVVTDATKNNKYVP